MEGGIILDNDFFVILAGAGLLDNWMKANGITHGQIYLLASLDFLLKKNSRLSRNHSQIILERAKEQAAQCQRLPVACGEMLQKFAGIEGIDPGEQQIFAHLATSSYKYAATNDKRSLQTLMSHPDLLPYLRNKIICLEQAIRTILKHGKWSETNEKIQRMRVDEKAEGHTIDARLSCIFPATTQSEENTMNAIESWLKELAGKYASLLANQQP